MPLTGISYLNVYGINHRHLEIQSAHCLQLMSQSILIGVHCLLWHVFSTTLSAIFEAKTDTLCFINTIQLVQAFHWSIILRCLWDPTQTSRMIDCPLLIVQILVLAEGMCCLPWRVFSSDIKCHFLQKKQTLLVLSIQGNSYTPLLVYHTQMCIVSTTDI